MSEEFKTRIVYFIEADDVTRPVKIGTTHRANMANRLRDIQMGNHRKLTLIRTIPGGLREEAWMHRYFAYLSIRGEWFRFSEEMLTIVPTHIGIDKLLEKRKLFRALKIPLHMQ